MISICALTIAFICIALADPFPSQIFLLLFIFSLFFISLSVAFKNTILTYGCIILFSIGLSLTVLEGYFYIALHDSKKVRTLTDSHAQAPKVTSAKKTPTKPHKQNTTSTQKNKEAEFNPEQVLSTRHAVRKVSAQNITIFDVVYGLNSKKKRITPYAPNAKKAVVLLGCSFTFGDGIKDNETSAWQLAKVLGDEYQIFNYGRSGSAPHKILADLQEDFPDLQKFSEVFFYYIAIDDHLRRVGGGAAWDNNGPLFEIQNGKAVRIGIFKHVLPFFRSDTATRWLNRSYFYDKIRTQAEDAFAPYNAEERIELFSALVQGIDHIIHKNYPQSNFTVLLWPPSTTEFIPLLKNIPYINLQSWFPNFEQEREKYVIFYPYEMHPSAYANSIVAKELAKLIRNAPTK